MPRQAQHERDGGVKVAKRLHIEGRVQGVFYRAWAVETARGLGLAGWVRNRADGSVEAYVVGLADAVGRFVAACRRGPAAARVASLIAEDATVERHDGFVQRASG